MTSLFTKRKIFVIAMCVFLVSLSTVLFFAGDKQFPIETHTEDMQTFIMRSHDMDHEKNEIFYRNFLNNHQDDIFIINPDTTIKLFTENWKNEFGYETQNVIDQNFFTFVHPKDLPFFANIFIEIIQKDEKVEGIGPFRMKDINGQYKLYIATGIPLKNENSEILEIALILRDVSTPMGSDGNPDEEESEESHDEVNDGFTSIISYKAKDILSMTR